MIHCVKTIMTDQDQVLITVADRAESAAPTGTESDCRYHAYKISLHISVMSPARTPLHSVVTLDLFGPNVRIVESIQLA